MSKELENLSKQITKKEKDINRKIKEFDKMYNEFARDFPVLRYKPRTIRSKKCNKKDNK